MKKVLLIGGSGFIGRNILEYFKESDKYSIIAPSSKELNILDEDKVAKYLQENYFDIVLNFAIYGDGVDKSKDGTKMLEYNLRMFLNFEKNLHAGLAPMNKEIHQFRAVKEAWELDRMRKAQEITDKAFTQMLTKIKAGLTEKQLQAELIYCLLSNGADGLAFDPIVVSGPKTSMPHGVAGDRVVQEGEFITMDFGALYGGYCADMTRTVAVGYATEEMEKVYNTVLEAQLAGIAATKSGLAGKEIDAAARKVIEDAGYGAYFGHGYGHCLGMEVHEAPNCNPSGEVAMQPGMVSSAEPGIYLPGKFGVRIEDVVIFTENGFENITRSPKNLIIV